MFEFKMLLLKLVINTNQLMLDVEMLVKAKNKLI